MGQGFVKWYRDTASAQCSSLLLTLCFEAVMSGQRQTFKTGGYMSAYHLVHHNTRWSARLQVCIWILHSCGSKLPSTIVLAKMPEGIRSEVGLGCQDLLLALHGGIFAPKSYEGNS
eukprot:6365589-Amphidinium_carterae.1